MYQKATRRHTQSHAVRKRPPIRGEPKTLSCVMLPSHAVMPRVPAVCPRVCVCVCRGGGCFRLRSCACRPLPVNQSCSTTYRSTKKYTVTYCHVCEEKRAKREESDECQRRDGGPGLFAKAVCAGCVPPILPYHHLQLKYSCIAVPRSTQSPMPNATCVKEALQESAGCVPLPLRALGTALPGRAAARRRTAGVGVGWVLGWVLGWVCRGAACEGRVFG
jgi:hypothetical protein